MTETAKIHARSVDCFEVIVEACTGLPSLESEVSAIPDEVTCSLCHHPSWS